MGRDPRGRNFGNLRLINCYGLKLVVSPDVCMWIIPTAITIGLFSGGIYQAGTRPLTRWSTTGTEVTSTGQFDFYFTIVLVLCALCFSLLCGLTDPGAIPRLEAKPASYRNNTNNNNNNKSGSASGSPTTAASTALENEHNRNNNRNMSPSAASGGGGGVAIDVATATTSSSSTAIATAAVNNNGNGTSNGGDFVVTSTSSPISNGNNNVIISSISGSSSSVSAGHAAGDSAIEMMQLSHERTPLTVDWDDLGFVDPYADQKNWTECKTCNIRRPPRTSHCYSCGVCILDCDHHCGVIGGHVGMRSIRYFAAYLICTALAALNTMTWLLTSLFDKNERANNPASMAINIMLLVFIGNVLLMVGGLACFYIWLVAVDLTRRENQLKRLPSTKTMVQHYHEQLTQQMLDYQQSRCLGNVRRVLHPPPSLIAWAPSPAAEKL